MPGFVDLHAHFLPGLDDGAKSIEAGVAMVRGLRALGFSILHATPHQRAGLFLPESTAIQAALDVMRETLGPAGDQTPCVDLAAENFWDEVFLARTQAQGAPGFPGDKAFLFEVDPGLLPPRLDETLFRFRLKGRLPVLAHPERYAIVQSDPSRAEALGRSAALLVDLGALDGAHGRAAMRTARFLLREGLAHGAASDVHRPEDLPSVAAGIAWIRSELGIEAVERLLADNPRRILAGDLP